MSANYEPFGAEIPLSSYAVMFGNKWLDRSAIRNEVELTSAELKPTGTIGELENFPSFVSRMLELDKSLIPDAWEKVVDFFPESALSSNVDPKTLLTLQNERLLRYGALTEEFFLLDSEPARYMGSLIDDASPGAVAFRDKLIEAAGDISQFDPNSGYPNPQEVLRGNNTFLDVIDPVVIDGKKYWAIQFMPQTDSPFELKHVFQKLPSSYLLVSSEEKNRELSNMFFSDRKLVRYYEAFQIIEKQTEKLRNLRTVFNSVAEQKRLNLDSELKPMNLAVQGHFFDLLWEVSTENPAIVELVLYERETPLEEIVSKAKDSEDNMRFAAFSLLGPLFFPSKDNPLPWTGTHYGFRIEHDQDNTLALTYNIDSTRRDVFYVKKAPDGRLMYGFFDNLLKIYWTDHATMETANVCAFFQNVNAVTLQQLQKGEPELKAKFPETIARLVGAKNLTTFFSELRQIQQPNPDKIIDYFWGLGSQGENATRIYTQYLQSPPPQHKASAN